MECFWNFLIKIIFIFIGVLGYVGITLGIPFYITNKIRKLYPVIIGGVIFFIGLFIFIAAEECGFINID